MERCLATNELQGQPWRGESKTLFNFEGLKGFSEGIGGEGAVESCEKYGGVAQLGEHLPCKQGVDSSNLFISTSGLKPQTNAKQSG